VNEPTAARDFIGLELRPKQFKPVIEARLRQQVFPEVRQLNPAAFGADGQALAAELNRARDEVVIRGASVFVSEDGFHSTNDGLASAVSTACETQRISSATLFR
jgi:hypothetical protein